MGYRLGIYTLVGLGLPIKQPRTGCMNLTWVHKYYPKECILLCLWIHTYSLTHVAINHAITPLYKLIRVHGSKLFAPPRYNFKELGYKIAVMFPIKYLFALRIVSLSVISNEVVFSCEVAYAFPV